MEDLGLLIMGKFKKKQFQIFVEISQWLRGRFRVAVILHPGYNARGRKLDPRVVHKNRSGWLLFIEKNNPVLIGVSLTPRDVPRQGCFYVEICIHPGRTLLLVPRCNFILVERPFFNRHEENPIKNMFCLPGVRHFFYLTLSLV